VDAGDGVGGGDGDGGLVLRHCSSVATGYSRMDSLVLVLVEGRFGLVELFVWL
jgi:hypothetical protein